MARIPVLDSGDKIPPRFLPLVSGRACSTDGTNGLPAPTGDGLEFVITAAGLDDIRFDGVSL